MSATRTFRCSRPAWSAPVLFVALLLLCSPTRAQVQSRPDATREVTRDERERDSTAAEQTNPRPSPAERRSGGWAVAGFVGGAHTRSSPLVISQPSVGTELTFDSVRLDGRSFDPPLYYGLRGGYFFRRPIVGRINLGAEAEFIHLKVYSDPAQRVRVSGARRGATMNSELPLGAIVGRYSISHGVNLLLFNLAARRSFSHDADGRGRFSLSARAGSGPTIPHTESTIENESQEQYELGRSGVQAAGGAEVRLVGGLHLLGEYKFTRTRQRGRIAGGEARSLLRTRHGVFGLSYHF